FGQAKFTISGTIKDVQTGESLIGASVTTAELKANGVQSNDYGFYSITLPAGDYNLLISYVGYKSASIKISLQKNTIVNQSLDLDADLREVVISSSRGSNENVAGSQM